MGRWASAIVRVAAGPVEVRHSALQRRGAGRKLTGSRHRDAHHIEVANVGAVVRGSTPEVLVKREVSGTAAA